MAGRLIVQMVRKRSHMDISPFHRSLCCSLLLVASQLFAAPFALAQIILSEVMFNPAGPESSDEFVEILNLSTADSVDLRGYLLGDQDALDLLSFPGGQYYLRPGQYAVIFDSDYSMSQGSYSGIIPAEALVLAVSDKTLGSGGLLNSRAETVRLVDASGRLVAAYTYSPDNPSGISDEKINPAGDDSAQNWANSRVVNGTPGRINSVSPNAIDLAIDPISYHLSPERPVRGDLVRLSFAVKNIGLRSARVDSLALAIDLNFDGLLTDDEVVSRRVVGLLLPPESESTVMLAWQAFRSSPFKGEIRIFVPMDEDLSTNHLAVQVPIRFVPGDLVINEIMAAPETGQPEWVELFNPGEEVVNLAGWQFADPRTRVAISEGQLHIAPGQYAILAQALFEPNSPTRVITLEKWPALNNDTDSLVLYDFDGTTIDSVVYTTPGGALRGISLERFNPHIGGAASTAWALSTSPSGSTPGAENSVFFDALPDRTSITVRPNPFAPEADGGADQLEIELHIPLALSQVMLTIYDLRGREVRRLLNNASSGATRRVFWDGRADGGRLLAPGIYIIYFEAIADRQGRIVTARKTVVLARRL